MHSQDALYQMYTSGTTGRPKGAVVTHQAITANIAQLTAAIPSRPADRSLVVMPLFHAGAAVAAMIWIASGVEIRVLSEFNAAACVHLLADENITWATLVPAMIQAMLVSVPDIGERGYNSLRGIVYGASPIAEETLRRAIDAFDCDSYQGYGLTETSAMLTLLMPSDHRLALAGRPEPLLSAGKPAAGTRLRIVDADDKDVPSGSVGEIIATGPQLMDGYWRMADATAEVMRDGWFHTGDAGYFDEDGYLYVPDRVKDMIVSGGENVYPRETEDVLFQLPQVADAAVVGVPDERWGEVGKAFVVLRPGDGLDEEAVIEWCRGRLATYKRPRSVEFVDELPRNPSGKVLKTVLRAPYWTNRARSV